MIVNLGGQNEPPHKKQRTSDGTDPMTSTISPQAQMSSMVTNKRDFLRQSFILVSSTAY